MKTLAAAVLLLAAPLFAQQPTILHAAHILDVAAGKPLQTANDSQTLLHLL